MKGLDEGGVRQILANVVPMRPYGIVAQAQNTSIRPARSGRAEQKPEQAKTMDGMPLKS